MGASLSVMYRADTIYFKFGPLMVTSDLSFQLSLLAHLSCMIFCWFKSEFWFFFFFFFFLLSNLYVFCSILVLEAPLIFNFPIFLFNLNIIPDLGQKKKNYVALSRPTVKCEKTGLGFFCFVFWKCQIWAKNLQKFVFNGLKKHLYMRFDCIPPEFSPFRNFKKYIGKLNSLTVRKKKKKKKKNRPTDPIFKFWSGEGNITIFFFGLMQRQTHTLFVYL